MAAIQVYKTDTFEIQRQKINQIGEVISNFSGGGNDFAAGNLKLGDGNIASPSLSFTSDTTLGLYKPFPKTLGFVSDQKKVFEISDSKISSFTNFIVQTDSLNNAQIRIDNRGREYDVFSYTNVPLEGGTGSGATANFVIEAFLGSILSYGTNYIPGNFTSVPLIGGSGSGATINFSVDTLQGQISDNGSGYLFGAYVNVPLQTISGSGSGAIADIVVDESGIVTTVIVRNSGQNYEANDTLTAADSDLGSNGGSGFIFTVTTNPGVIRDVVFNTKGDGYFANDILELRKKVSGITSTFSTTTRNIVVSSGTGIINGDIVRVTSGTGSLPSGVTKVQSINGNNVTLDRNPSVSGSVTLEFLPPYGDGDTDFRYQISEVGLVSEFEINQGGSGYIQNDILSVDEKNLVAPNQINVQATEIQRLTFAPGDVPSGSFSLGGTVSNDDGDEGAIYKIVTSGGSITEMLIDNLGFVAGGILTAGEVTFTIQNAFDIFRWFLDSNNDGFFDITPSLTLIPGETYIFDTSFGSIFEDHTFSLSRYPGGNKGRSLVQGVTATLSQTSNQIIVSDSTNIQSGMVVSVTAGDGVLITDTRVSEVNGNIVTLTKVPLSSGSTTLTFKGVEYTSNVTRELNKLILKVTEDTPNLYYYCSQETTNLVNHDDEGGDENEEAILTVDTLNPRTTYGSGFQITIAEIESVESIVGDSSSGNLSSISFNSNTAEIETLVVNSSLSSALTDTNNLIVGSISSKEDGSGEILWDSSDVFFRTNLYVSDKLSIQESSGNLVTSGSIKCGGFGLNVNDFISIVNNNISSTTGNNLLLSPAPLRVAKVNSTTALVIPVGTNNQRPQAAVVETGAIRFNTDTQQYEGYNASASSWSSLGGVRDVDGNTYILAEASVGSNDNTIYFYNNNQNTLRLTNNYLDFRSTKKIRSENMSAPSYTEWRPNTPVSVGQYLKYKENIYEVINAGTTDGSANPPIHTVGGQFNNDAFLVWYTSAVDDIIFEEVSSVQIDPNGTNPLVINSELVLESSIIRSQVNDIIIFPASGKKVEISAQSSLVIPSGDNNSRGSAVRGSIRFNTTILQYEGYDGTNWSSLGGVRDVDGNTYIIPELGAGTNENILYFFNDDNNTLQLSSSGLDFYSTDNITSSQSNVLNINVENVTFNSSEFSIDNSGLSTVLTSAKESIDLNLSTGLTTEKLISLTDEGSFIVNNGYSTGSVSDITLFDYQLKSFELSDIKESTEDITLTRGTINSGSTIVYNPTVHVSGKLSVIVENITKNERELIEFNICHKGGDIFYTEYGNVSTNGELISTTFNFTASNEVRANFTLNTVNNSNGDVVNIVAIKTSIKK